MSNHCLVCGPKKSGKKNLLLRVMKNDSATFKKDPSQNFEVCEWNTSNKYYNAQISFTVVTDRATISTLAPFQAIVLVLDLTSSHPVIKNELMEWNHVLSSSSETAMSCLLVGNYPNMDFWDSIDNKKKEHIMQMHEHLHEWCVNHNYEFIPSPHIPSDNNSNSNSNNVWKDVLSSYSAEELGSRRVFDALQCVNWPEMTMAPRKIGGASRPTETKEDDNHEEEKEEKKHASVVIKEKPESKTQDNVDKIIEDDHMSAEEDEEDEDDNEDNNSNNNGLIHQFAKMWSDEKVKHESTQEGKDNKRSDNVEWNIQAFESLVEEMKSVRQASLSGKLSYEERKKAAAEAAMKLYQYMGLDGLEDELSDGETVDID